jgi:hypothetical protein
MLAASQGIKTKLRTFFAHFNDASRRHLYGVLTLELDNLASETSMLSSMDTGTISAQLHKYKGICRYLKIDNEALYSDETNKIELLGNITTLQVLLKDIESEM